MPHARGHIVGRSARRDAYDAFLGHNPERPDTRGRGVNAARASEGVHDAQRCASCTHDNDLNPFRFSLSGFWKRSAVFLK